MDNDIKEKILIALKKEPKSASTLAKELEFNRVTISKYLEILKAENKITYTDVAQAKLWTLTTNQKPLILVVDDEKHVVKLIKLTLKTRNYQIKEAFSGKEAFTLLKEIQPDLIILDLMMPEISGFQILEELRKEKNPPPVLILSAKGQLHDKVKGFASGALAYLSKPFDPLELDARVKHILRRKEITKISPLTQLPQREQIIRFLREAVFSKTHTFFTSLHIKNSEMFTEQCGYQKMHTFLTTFARMLTEELPPKSFAGYDEYREQFILATNDAQTVNKMRVLLNEVAKYCFSDCSDLLKQFKIENTSLSLGEIENKKIYIDDVLTLLNLG